MRRRSCWKLSEKQFFKIISYLKWQYLQSSNRPERRCSWTVSHSQDSVPELRTDSWRSRVPLMCPPTVSESPLCSWPWSPPAPTLATDSWAELRSSCEIWLVCRRSETLGLSSDISSCVCSFFCSMDLVFCRRTLVCGHDTLLHCHCSGHCCSLGTLELSGWGDWVVALEAGTDDCPRWLVTIDDQRHWDWRVYWLEWWTCWCWPWSWSHGPGARWWHCWCLRSLTWSQVSEHGVSVTVVTRLIH